MTNQELYEYIGDSVLDADSNIVTLLLRYKELAQRLGYVKYVTFASNELDGYVEQKPDNHRALRYSVYADVIPFWDSSQKTHARLTDKQKAYVLGTGRKREYPVFWECRKGVVELAAALRQNAGNVIDCELPDETNVTPAEEYRNIKVEYSRIEIAKLFHDIRSFVAMDMRKIGKEHPELLHASKPSKSRVEKMTTNITIQGSNNQVATASGDVNQSMTIGGSPEQLGELVALLQQQHVMQEDIEELKTILRQNPPHTKDEVGDKIGNWFGRVAVRAAQAGYEISIGVIVAAISKFLGLV